MAKKLDESAKVAYQKVQSDWWQGRIDDEAACRVHQLIQLWDAEKEQKSSSVPLKIAILGCASDEGVRRNQGRVGAKEGPKALRSALANKVLHGTKHLCLYDAGNIEQDQGLERTQELLGQTVEKLQKNRMISVVLGGGHEIAYGHFLGIYAAHKPATIGVINIDAHFDLRPLLPQNLGSSGTPFLQMANKAHAEGNKFHYLCIGAQASANSPALFKKMKELDAQYISADEINDSSQHWKVSVRKFLIMHQYIYLSICLDAFAAAFAPGVSAPQALGLNPLSILSVLKEIASSGKMVGMDVAELCPALDPANQTAQLGAQIIVELIQSLIDHEAHK